MPSLRSPTATGLGTSAIPGGISSQFKPMSYQTNLGMSLKDTLSQKADDNHNASMNNSVMSLKQ